MFSLMLTILLTTRVRIPSRIRMLSPFAITTPSIPIPTPTWPFPAFLSLTLSNETLSALSPSSVSPLALLFLTHAYLLILASLVLSLTYICPQLLISILCWLIVVHSVLIPSLLIFNLFVSMHLFCLLFPWPFAASSLLSLIQGSFWFTLALSTQMLALEISIL